MNALPEIFFRLLQFASLIILLSLSLNSLAQAPIIHPGPPAVPPVISHRNGQSKLPRPVIQRLTSGSCRT